ncbi:GLPGLI family protein [Sphingobacterium sp. LRF_L2]|uniref:GLPGLI family protein n=1 Tax=Sphingobacterium sp. LRF_L2 TaxID=3369421 RepID=UPI003F647285
MKKQTWIIVLLTLVTKVLVAQYAHFPTGGVIHFEKTVHVKNFMKRQMALAKNDNFDRSYVEQLMSKAPNTYVFKSTLSFQGDESRAEPVKEELTNMMRNLIWYGFDYSTTYYKHLKNNSFKSLLEYGGSNILTQDSLLDIKWKITNEYRDIAGYSCRRANGILLDSIFVVAFYTDEIPLSSGPAVFHGLPGMILGAAVPEQHYSIYATKVELYQPVITAELGKKRDKPMSRMELYNFMRDRMGIGDWSTEEEFNFLMINLLL